jgi:hypothetical protein
MAWQQKIAERTFASVYRKDPERVVTGLVKQLPNSPMQIVANRYVRLAQDGFAAVANQLRVMDPVAKTG